MTDWHSRIAAAFAAPFPTDVLCPAAIPHAKIAGVLVPLFVRPGAGATPEGLKNLTLRAACYHLPSMLCVHILHFMKSYISICFIFAEDVRVLLTVRSSRLASHPGEVAFPGGKWDRTDATLVRVLQNYFFLFDLVLR